MTPSSAQGSWTKDEQFAILTVQVKGLLDAYKELADLLKAHMEREERTTEEIFRRLISMEKRQSNWYGVAIGVTLAISAVWAVVLVVVDLAT